MVIPTTVENVRAFQGLVRVFCGNNNLSFDREEHVTTGNAEGVTDIVFRRFLINREQFLCLTVSGTVSADLSQRAEARLSFSKDDVTSVVQLVELKNPWMSDKAVQDIMQNIQRQQDGGYLFTGNSARLFWAQFR